MREYNMKTEDIQKIDDKCTEQKGFMVEFEKRVSGMLRSGHFPDKHAGKLLIKTEEEAWESARRFARDNSQDHVNIYVIDQDFRPVKGFYEKILRKYP
jgi:hypothetical protein